VATDQTGKTLIWASYSDGVVGSHALAENGAVKPGALSRIETKRCAHAILTDSSNRFAFVPHTGPNAVYQFRFDAKSGKLTKNDPLTASSAAGLEPRHLAFHPRLPVVYCDDEKGDSVTAYHFNRDTGQLKAFHSQSTLPTDFDGSQNTCADIEITRDGRFVYASNRGHNSIAGFSVDAKTGKLTSIGQFVTGAIPRSFNLGPDNQWMVAAGQRSHDLHVYKRDSTSGKLNRIYQQPTGQGPSWVQFIPKESK
jgi:6-phosphogluconolactonase